MTPAEVWEQAALLCTTAGIIAGLLAVTRTRQLVASLRLAVEFWAAAGLLRLGSDSAWPTVAAAAGILAIRQLINFGIHQSHGLEISWRRLR